MNSSLADCETIVPGAPRRKRSAAAVLLLLLATIGAKSCAGSPSPKGEFDKLLILVSIDTLRADHLHAYGYPRAVTPFLDRMAAEGIRFTHAYTSMATTTPAHASIFTGLYPLEHGVMRNGLVLDEDKETIAEILRSEGVRTAGFASVNPMFAPSGLHQGFSHWDEPSNSYDKPEPGEPRYRAAAETVDRVEAWLEGTSGGGTVFLFVHLFDPHRPYGPPQRHLDAVKNDTGLPGRRLPAYLKNRRGIDLDFFKRAGEDPVRKYNAYDGEVRYVDTELARLYRSIHKRGANPDTIWVITADHGQGLGNHNWMRHGKHIYNEQIRVPLIIRLPGHLSGDMKGGRVEDRLVEHIDLFPTILDYFEIDSQRRPQASHGRSIMPILRDPDAEIPLKTAFIERRTYAKKKPPHFSPERHNYEEGETFAITDGRYKYLHRTEGRDELFCIRDDPYETKNVIDLAKGERERLASLLREKLQSLTRPASGAPPIDPRLIERLRALGYTP